MKFFKWMHNKFNGRQENRKVYEVLNTNDTKEEFNEWPNGLLAIGTFGNTYLGNKQEIHIEQNQESSENISQLRRLLNCPSSLEVDLTTISKRFNTINPHDEHGKEGIEQSIRIVLESYKYVCDKKKKAIGKERLLFLLKKIFVCTRGYEQVSSLKDTLQESRMLEKLLKTMIKKKIYPQNSDPKAPLMAKRILEGYKHTQPNIEKECGESQDKTHDGSKWDKTDSEYIVLEIENELRR